MHKQWPALCRAAESDGADGVVRWLWGSRTDGFKIARDNYFYRWKRLGFPKAAGKDNRQDEKEKEYQARGGGDRCWFRM